MYNGAETGNRMALLVNEEYVADETIQREIASLRQRFQKMTPEQQQAQGIDPRQLEQRWPEWARENVIEQVLLQQEARKDTSPVPPEAIESARRQLAKKESHTPDAFQHFYGDTLSPEGNIETRIRLDRLLDSITAKVATPKTKEAAEFYRKNKEQFRTPEMVRAAHIVKNVDEKTDADTARAAMKQVEEKMRAGASFEELADAHSDCPGNGGALGFFPRGRMVEEFDEAVFSLPAGEVSPAFRTEFGFHIAKVYERKAPSIVPFADIQEEIQRMLRRQKQVRAVEAFVDRLRAGADVQEAGQKSEHGT